MRAHLELGRTREVLVADGSARRVEDEVDEVVLLPRLVQPVLGWLLGAESCLAEHVERAVGVLFAEEEVDVVIGRRAAARPDRETATEHVVDARSRVAPRPRASSSRAASGSSPEERTA